MTLEEAKEIFEALGSPVISNGVEEEIIYEVCLSETQAVAGLDLKMYNIYFRHGGKDYIYVWHQEPKESHAWQDVAIRFRKAARLIELYRNVRQHNTEVLREIGIVAGLI